MLHRRYHSWGPPVNGGGHGTCLRSSERGPVLGREDPGTNWLALTAGPRAGAFAAATKARLTETCCRQINHLEGVLAFRLCARDRFCIRAPGTTSDPRPGVSGRCLKSRGDPKVDPSFGCGLRFRLSSTSAEIVRPPLSNFRVRDYKCMARESVGVEERSGWRVMGY